MNTFLVTEGLNLSLNFQQYGVLNLFLKSFVIFLGSIGALIYYYYTNYSLTAI